MTENSEPVAAEAQKQERPPALSPAYKPAEEDSKLFLRMVGNTAVLAEWQPINMDAFQLMAMGQFLLDKGRQMISMQEAAAAQQLAQQRIVTAGRIPADPSAFPPDLKG